MKKKKIVFFDTWVTGLRHTDIVAEVLYKHYDIVFLSIDKFHNKYISQSQKKLNKDIYSNRVQNNVFYSKVTDLSEYNFSITEFFQKEKPDIGVTISIHNLDHRWFNSACQVFNVPCVFIMHGIKGDSVDSNITFSFNILNYLKRLLFYNFLFFHYKKDIPQKKFVRKQSIFQEWKELIFSHHKYKFNPTDDYNVRYLKGFITDKEDIDFFLQRYPSLGICKFIEIGPIDLIDLEKTMNNYSFKKEFVLFVGQPSESSISDYDYFNNLRMFKKYFENHGTYMQYRPHPHESYSQISKIKKLGINILEEDLPATLSKTFLVVGYYSTLLLTCLKFNYPVISLKLKAVPHPKPFFGKKNSFVYNSFIEFEKNFNYYKVIADFSFLKKKNNILSNVILQEFKNMKE